MPISHVSPPFFTTLLQGLIKSDSNFIKCSIQSTMQKAEENSTQPSGWFDFVSYLRIITLATGLVLLENLPDSATREKYRQMSHSPMGLASFSNHFFYIEKGDPDLFVPEEIFAQATLLYGKFMRDRGWDVATIRDRSADYKVPAIGYLQGTEYGYPIKIPPNNTDTKDSFGKQIADLFVEILNSTSLTVISSAGRQKLKYPIKSISHLFASRNLFGGYINFPSDLLSSISKPEINGRVLQEMRNELLTLRLNSFDSFSKLSSDEKFVNDLFGSLEDTLQDDMNCNAKSLKVIWMVKLIQRQH